MSLRLTLACCIREEGQDPVSADEVAQLTEALPSFFMFAITWSIGATADVGGRMAFDQFLREKATGEKLAIFAKLYILQSIVSQYDRAFLSKDVCNRL